MDDYGYGVVGGVNTMRDRVVPWLQDDREMHPDPIAKPLANLFRFFEFVECHSRMRGAVTAADPVAGPTETELANRQMRVPGKININTLTDEEVFRALVDESEAMPTQPVEDLGNGRARPIDPQRIPSNYYYAPANPPQSPPIPPELEFWVSDFQWRRNLQFGDLFRSQTSLSSGATNGIFFGSVDPTFDLLSTEARFQDLRIEHRFLDRMWPGVFDDSSDDTGLTDADIPPGRNPLRQVHSELFRMFLLSRAGRDGIYGTGDDKPFRSFAAGRLSDTLLRRRNYTRLDYPEGEHVDGVDPVAGGRGEFVRLTAGRLRLLDPTSLRSGGKPAARSIGDRTPQRGPKRRSDQSGIRPALSI